MGAWRSGDSSFPKVLRSGQKYLQCQEVFWKIFEKIQYRADLLLGICEQIHSPCNLAQSQGGSVLLYQEIMLIYSARTFTLMSLFKSFVLILQAKVPYYRFSKNKNLKI